MLAQSRRVQQSSPAGWPPHGLSAGAARMHPGSSANSSFRKASVPAESVSTLPGLGPASLPQAPPTFDTLMCPERTHTHTHAAYTPTAHMHMHICMHTHACNTHMHTCTCAHTYAHTHMPTTHSWMCIQRTHTHKHTHMPTAHTCKHGHSTHTRTHIQHTHAHRHYSHAHSTRTCVCTHACT